MPFFCFVLGSIFASFATCIGYRIFNLSTKLTKRNSICTICGKNLKPQCLIPIVSYFFILRGKCLFCKQKISIIYPLCEISLGLYFVFLYFIFNININLLFLCYLLFTLLAIQCVSDMFYKMCSDFISFIIFICCLIIAHVYFQIPLKQCF